MAAHHAAVRAQDCPSPLEARLEPDGNAVRRNNHSYSAVTSIAGVRYSRAHLRHRPSYSETRRQITGRAAIHRVTRTASARPSFGPIPGLPPITLTRGIRFDPTGKTFGSGAIQGPGHPMPSRPQSRARHQHPPPSGDSMRIVSIITA